MNFVEESKSLAHSKPFLIGLAVVVALGVYVLYKRQSQSGSQGTIAVQQVQPSIDLSGLITGQNNLSKLINDRLTSLETGFGGSQTALATGIEKGFTTQGNAFQQGLTAIGANISAALDSLFNGVAAVRTDTAGLIGGQTQITNLGYRTLGSRSAAACLREGKLALGCVRSSAQDFVSGAGGGDVYESDLGKVQADLQTRYATCYSNGVFDLTCVGKKIAGG